MAKIKEENYFDLLIGSAKHAGIAANYLEEIINNYNPNTILEQSEKMHEIEHAADAHFHKICDQLNRSFMTPIERDDILHIAETIDDFIDLIEDIPNRLYMFNVDVLREEIKEFSAIIKTSSELLIQSVTEFKTFAKSKTIHTKIRELGDKEEEGDVLFKKANRRLFSDNSPEIEVLKWREIFSKLENCLDCCEAVGGAMYGAILQNS